VFLTGPASQAVAANEPREDITLEQMDIIPAIVE
jgi:hypothetical protein